jgi:hypothetical protein
MDPSFELDVQPPRAPACVTHSNQVQGSLAAKAATVIQRGLGPSQSGPMKLRTLQFASKLDPSLLSSVKAQIEELATSSDSETSDIAKALLAKI